MDSGEGSGLTAGTRAPVDEISTIFCAACVLISASEELIKNDREEEGNEV